MGRDEPVPFFFTVFFCAFVYAGVLPLDASAARLVVLAPNDPLPMPKLIFYYYL